MSPEEIRCILFWLANILFCHTGPTSIFMTRCLNAGAQNSRCAAGHPPPAGRAEVELFHTPSGGSKWILGGKVTLVPAGRMGVYWTGFAHTAGAALPPRLWIRVPLELFLEWPLPVQLRGAVMSGRIVFEPRADRQDVDAPLFRAWVDEIRRRSGRVTDWTLLEIEARLGRLAEAAFPEVAGNPPAGYSEEAASVAARLALFLGDHYPEPIHARELARVTGLSLPAARRCFQQVYGITPHRYLLHLRLAQAKKLIAGAQTKIIDVAMETGFPTVSNFYRTFEAEVGQTPSAYRKSHGCPGIRAV